MTLMWTQKKKNKKTQYQIFFFNSPKNLNMIERKKMNRLVKRERERERERELGFCESSKENQEKRLKRDVFNGSLRWVGFLWSIQTSTKKFSKGNQNKLFLSHGSIASLSTLCRLDPGLSVSLLFSFFFLLCFRFLCGFLNFMWVSHATSVNVLTLD